MTKCGAKTRTPGKLCKSYAMKNGRCRMHGGKAPSGIASASFKDGRYSKDIPSRLAERYTEAANDTELLAMRDDIALIDARLSDLLQRVDTGESGSLWAQANAANEAVREAYHNGNAPALAVALNQLNEVVIAGRSDYAAWDEISKALEQRRRLVESERKRLVDMQQMITANQAMVLFSNVLTIIRDNVSDRKTLNTISAAITELATVDAG